MSALGANRQKPDRKPRSAVACAVSWVVLSFRETIGAGGAPAPFGTIRCELLAAYSRACEQIGKVAGHDDARGYMKRLMVAFVGAALVVTTIANGQSDPRQAGSTNAPYKMPSLADIMSLTQWRHLKLAYAGRVRNWPLAGYEVGQMQQSFSAAAQLFPVYKDIPLAQLIKEESEPALAEVGKAIERSVALWINFASTDDVPATQQAHRADTMSGFPVRGSGTRTTQ